VKYYRNGKAYRECTHKTDEKEARDFLTKRWGEIVTGNFSGPKTEPVRIDELAEDFLRDCRINGKRSLDDLEARWKLHLKPFFSDLRAVNVSSDLVVIECPLFGLFFNLRPALLLSICGSCLHTVPALVPPAAGNSIPTAAEFAKLASGDT
jgi:hypothetical protein